MTKQTASNPKFRGRPLNEQIILGLAFGFGTGFIRPAPGTWGTLPGVFIGAWVMSYPLWHWVTIIIVMIIGIWLCHRASQILGVHDHSGIVIDEIAGVLLTLWLFEPTGLTLVLGFVYFRLFDIIKPWPIRWIDQHVHGGLGIMLDDLLAACFAWALLYLTLMWIM